jgi:hypothetical protein
MCAPLVHAKRQLGRTSGCARFVSGGSDRDTQSFGCPISAGFEPLAPPMMDFYDQPSFSTACNTPCAERVQKEGARDRE